MPFLHDHKRCVPPQNVYRCIVIGIHVVPGPQWRQTKVAWFSRLFPSTVPHSEQVCDV